MTSAQLQYYEQWIPETHDQPATCAIYRPPTLGICSGYFRLGVHDGHIDYLYAAKEHCDYLWVIVNNDKQLKLKNKFSPFTLSQRMKMVEAIKPVDCVSVSNDEDRSVSETLRTLHRRYSKEYDLVFINDGDVNDESKLAEKDICEKLGISILFLNNNKVNASTDIEQSIINHHECEMAAQGYYWTTDSGRD